MLKKIKAFAMKIFLSRIIKQKGVKQMFEKIRLSLENKKSYLTAAGIIIAAIIEYIGNGDIAALINRILEAIAIITVRAAIAKI